MDIIHNNIIHSYVNDLENNKSLNYRTICITDLDKLEIKVNVNTNSRISDIKNIFRNYYNYPCLEFFLPSTGIIIENNEHIGNYIQDNKLYIIKKIQFNN